MFRSIYSAVIKPAEPTTTTEQQDATSVRDPMWKVREDTLSEMHKNARNKCVKENRSGKYAYYSEANVFKNQYEPTCSTIAGTPMFWDINTPAASSLYYSNVSGISNVIYEDTKKAEPITYVNINRLIPSDADRARVEAEYKETVNKIKKDKERKEKEKAEELERMKADFLEKEKAFVEREKALLEKERELLIREQNSVFE